MGRIILLPIEPLEERYSADWLEWWQDELYEDDYIITPKPLTTTITQGSFLDVCGTNYYKAKQLANCCEMIHNKHIEDGDTFLLLDGWFPGVEMLAYMRDALGINFKITGCFHAGTYDPYDFLTKKNMGRWGHDLENSWMKIYDRIFVATKFHKQLIASQRVVRPEQIKVTGFPIKEFPILPKRPKKNIVVFPHRLDSEKNPLQFEAMKDALSPLFPSWSFVKSKDLTLTKAEYYELLHDAKIAVSFADQETWGIAMQEAVLCGCYPIVPDRLSYREMYPDVFRYSSTEHATLYVKNLIESMNDGHIDHAKHSEFIKLQNSIIYNGSHAIPNIIKEIRDVDVW